MFRSFIKSLVMRIVRLSSLSILLHHPLIYHLRNPHPILLPLLIPIHLNILPSPQPLIPLPNLIPLPRQTPLRNPNILPNILHQRLLTHIIIFRPYKPQYHQTKLRAIKVLLEAVQDVDFDAALAVLVVRVVADGEDSGVDCGGRRRF